MGIEATGNSGNTTPVQRNQAGAVAPKADAQPKMQLDALNFSLPAGQPRLKIELPQEELHDQRKPFMVGAFEKGPGFKPRLGVSKDLGDGAKLDLDATFKHGGGVKIGYKKTF